MTEIVKPLSALVDTKKYKRTKKLNWTQESIDATVRSYTSWRIRRHRSYRLMHLTMELEAICIWWPTDKSE